ncbi:MAG: ThiF family adenylyltransferase [Planctomycetota bacterium]
MTAAEWFDRQERIRGWDQSRLREAAVVVVGLGAIGSEVAQNLAKLGVGRLLLCDHDVIEPSNLSRISYAAPGTVGRHKAEVAAEELGRIAPDCEVETRTRAFQSGVGLAELREADLVFSCLDTRAERVELNGRCNLVATPLIDGGTHPWGGEVRFFVEADGPCFACVPGPATGGATDPRETCLDESEPELLPSHIGTSALVAAWMCTLGARVLMGMPVQSGIVLVDCLRHRATSVAIERDPECAFHNAIGPTTLVQCSHRQTVGDLLQLLPEGACPIAWHAIPDGGYCRLCATKVRARTAAPDACPECGGELIASSTLELASIATDRVLGDLGVAPREILAVDIRGEIQWFELVA